MNEVGSTSVSSQMLAPVASSKGGAEAVAEAGGKKLPAATDNAKNEEKRADSPHEELNVEQAVASISDYVQSVQRDLQFSVDEELNQTVVKVVDGRSGDLIRQIPEEAFLELARKLNDGGGLHLLDALG